MTMRPHGHPSPPRRRKSPAEIFGSIVAGVAVASVSLLGTAVPAMAQIKPPGEYIEIDFTAAEPTSYNHLTGGGAYDAGVSNVDTVQSLEGRDFGCGDIVSFMTKIKMNDSEAGLYGATTLRMRYSWDMASTGSQTGVAFADLIHAQINYGTINDLLEPGSTIDDAIKDDGGSIATIHSETQTGPIWTSGSELVSEIDITDLEAGETIVLQLDLKLKCDPSQTSSGNIQAQLDQTQVIAVAANPENAPIPGKVNSGERTIPMKAGSIRYPQISMTKTVTTPTGSCATATDSIAINSGEQVKYCYTILNPSNVLAPPGRPLYQVRLKDDNGTPAILGDDWWVDTATITGLQDLDGLGQMNDLAPGATAYASVVRTITGTSGSTVTNIATAYGDDSVIQPYTLEDSDNANVTLFVAAPGVAIAKTTGNTIDETPSDSPMIFAGDVVNWYYEVTNTGNVALNTIGVTDNRGVTVSCPASTLAVGAKMTCTAAGTAIAGNYTNIGTVVAHYNSETVTASDPSGYFGRNPQIDVTKLPASQTVVEGAAANFSITVTNTGNVALSSVSLSDPLSTDCSGPLADLGVGESRTVTCSRNNVTAPFTNVVTASGSYGSRTVTDTASAVVNVDYLPDIAVTKTANPTHVSELGGSVTFTVVVTNNGVDAFTLNTLTDSEFGNLNGKGTCAVPQTIAASGTYSCSFSETIAGQPSTPHVDTVTASGVDPQGNPDTATDDASVTFDDVLPDITVTKTANPTHVSELGGSVLFTVVVTNHNGEAVTLTSLTDNMFGNLAGKGTCATGGSIAGGGSYTCSFTETLSGQPATPHDNTVTAVASDNDGNSDTATASAQVTFDDVLPDISVTKTANPTHVSELGGTVTFTVVVTNHNGEAVTLTSLTDNLFGNLAGKGTCATGGSITGGGTYTCTFTAPLIGEPATPHTNTVTAVASDNDGNSDTATASATVTFDDVLPNISVLKTANPTTLPVSGGYVDYLIRITNSGAEAVTITNLSDLRLTLPGTCTTAVIGAVLAPGAWIDCTLTQIWVVPDASGNFTNTATATGCDNDGNCDTDTSTATVVFSWYGRTPGYWKNHPEAWPGPYTTGQLLSTVFTLPGAITTGSGKPQVGDTLLMALAYQGGSGVRGAAQILLRAAVAAVLNEQYYTTWYPAESVNWIRTQVNTALASGNRSTILTLAGQLDGWNNGIEGPLP